MANELLNIKQAVAYTGLAHQSIYQAVREGRLKAERTNPYLFSRAELDRWMAARDAKKDRAAEEPE